MLVYLSQIGILYVEHNPISTSDYRELLEKNIGVALRDQIPRPSRGGKNNKSKHFVSDDDYKRLARKGEELIPLWEFITRFFEDLGYDAGCSAMIKRHSRFKELARPCAQIPDDLVNRVFKRKSEAGEKYWPLAFALEHARRELGIEYEYKFWTLKKYYEKGKNLISPQKDKLAKTASRRKRSK
jgi:hypothetical protein